MELNEAKNILNENGYYLLEASTYVGFPFMRILWERILREEDKNENKLETHSNDPSKWIDVDFYDGSLRIYKTNTGIRGEFDNGRKFTYKTTGQNKWNAADECAKFIISVVNGEISERKAKEKLNFKEAKKVLNKNGYVLKERFVNVDEIRVPEWLWVAYETGDTSNLEDEEIVILHIFEKDHKKHHLEANEEPNFYRTNDVTDEGGMCYTVQVFEDR